jgi:hypothetical protein
MPTSIAQLPALSISAGKDPTGINGFSCRELQNNILLAAELRAPLWPALQ